MLQHIFSSAYNLVIYSLALVGLLLTYATGWVFWYWFVISIFVLWHFMFLLSPEALADRKPEKTAELIAAGRLTSSWYFAVYAGAFAFIIVDKNRAANFLSYAHAAHILGGDLVLPVAYFFVGTLIVPVKLAFSRDDNASITWAARALVFVNGTAQNLGVYTILTLATRFVRVLHG